MFHKFLKDARELSGLSQLDVAKKFKYTSAQFISNWERGLSTPPPKSMHTLAKLYSIDENIMISKFIEGKMDAKLRQIKGAIANSKSKRGPKRRSNRKSSKSSSKV